MVGRRGGGSLADLAIDDARARAVIEIDRRLPGRE
jgi:hypothetical protein